MKPGPAFLTGLLLAFLSIHNPSWGQPAYKSPQLIIYEDFTDGEFDDFGAGNNGQNWRFFGSEKVDFLAPNGRDFEYALAGHPTYGHDLSFEAEADKWQELDNFERWLPITGCIFDYPGRKK